MSSSSGCGAASNTRRCTCGPTTASARPATQSADTWTSTTAADRIRALTARHPIKPTSPSRPSAWQPNLGRRSTYRRGKTVQTSGVTSLVQRQGEAAGARLGRNDRGGITFSAAGINAVFSPNYIDLESRLKAMDETGIDAQVLSLMASMVYWAPPAFGLALAQTYN